MPVEIPITFKGEYVQMDAESHATSLIDKINTEVENKDHPSVWILERGFPEILKNSIDSARAKHTTKATEKPFEESTHVIAEVSEADGHFTIKLKDKYLGFHYQPNAEEKQDRIYLQCLQDLNNGKDIDYSQILRGKKKIKSEKSESKDQLGGNGLGLSDIYNLLKVFQGTLIIKNERSASPGKRAKYACLVIKVPLNCVLNLEGVTDPRILEMARNFTTFHSAKAPQYFPGYTNTDAPAVSLHLPKKPTLMLNINKPKFHFSLAQLTEADDGISEIKVSDSSSTLSALGENENLSVNAPRASTSPSTLFASGENVTPIKPKVESHTKGKKERRKQSRYPHHQ
jgi:hypothetical protein